MMKSGKSTFARGALMAILCLVLTSLAWASDALQIKLKDGSTWRGSVNDSVEVRFKEQGVERTLNARIIQAADLYLKVEAVITGSLQQKVIFKTDIVAMKTLTGGAPIPTGQAAVAAAPDTSKPGDSGPAAGTPKDGKPMGVFVLPMKGMVGEGFRHDEIEAIAKEADKWGPGQIIILELESGGGLGIEMEQIHHTIMDVKKRHRVISWVKEAISAAAATASNCDEIYFYTTGTLGAMTGFKGGVAYQGEELRRWLDTAGKWMESGGRSKYIAWAMIDDAALLSYDKDPATGKVTWYNDLSGEVVLSDAKTNLVFTSSTAMDSGFADGIADTPEDLAKLLHLPEWKELSDYGRRISDDWLDTVERAKVEIPLIFERFQYEGRGSGDPVVVMGKQIQNIEKLISWWNRCPNVCFLSGVPPKDNLERQLAELRKALADMKKRAN